MIEEKQDLEQVEAPRARRKAKRDIFRFNGERLTALNLEHVTNMCLEGKKITFSFYSTSLFVELADEAAAGSAFDAIMNAWACDVVE